jgi:hypothetical protein
MRRYLVNITSTPIFRCQDPALFSCTALYPNRTRFGSRQGPWLSVHVSHFRSIFLTDVAAPHPPPPFLCSSHIPPQHTFSSSSPPMSPEASLASKWSSPKSSAQGSKSSTTSAPGFPMSESKLEAELAIEAKAARKAAAHSIKRKYTFPRCPVPVLERQVVVWHES